MTGLCLAEYLLRQTPVNKCNCPDDSEHTFIQDSGPGKHRLLLYLSKVKLYSRYQTAHSWGWVWPYSLLLHCKVGGLKSMFRISKATTTANVGQFHLCLSFCDWTRHVILHRIGFTLPNIFVEWVLIGRYLDTFNILIRFIIGSQCIATRDQGSMAHVSLKL